MQCLLRNLRLEGVIASPKRVNRTIAHYPDALVGTALLGNVLFLERHAISWQKNYRSSRAPRICVT